MIIWELWKKRNSMKHEGMNVTEYRVQHNIIRNLRMLLKVRKPYREFPYTWREILKKFENYRARVKVTKVM